MEIFDINCHISYYQIWGKFGYNRGAFSREKIAKILRELGKIEYFLYGQKDRDARTNGQTEFWKIVCHKRNKNSGLK